MEKFIQVIFKVLSDPLLRRSVLSFYVRLVKRQETSPSVGYMYQPQGIQTRNLASFHVAWLCDHPIIIWLFN